MFPDLINISSAVKLFGNLSSYSLIKLFPHLIVFSKFENSVSILIKFSSKAEARVKVLKTDPSS